MTWKQALLKSINGRWDAICFEGKIGMNEQPICYLCLKSDSCSDCIIGKVADGCGNENLPPFSVLELTKPEDGILAYLFLCMLYHEYYGEDE